MSMSPSRGRIVPDHSDVSRAVAASCRTIPMSAEQWPNYAGPFRCQPKSGRIVLAAAVGSVTGLRYIANRTCSSTWFVNTTVSFPWPVNVSCANILGDLGRRKSGNTAKTLEDECAMYFRNVEYWLSEDAASYFQKNGVLGKERFIYSNSVVHRDGVYRTD